MDRGNAELRLLVPVKQNLHLPDHFVEQRRVAEVFILERTAFLPFVEHGRAGQRGQKYAVYALFARDFDIPHEAAEKRFFLAVPGRVRENDKVVLTGAEQGRKPVSSLVVPEKRRTPCSFGLTENDSASMRRGP